MGYLLALYKPRQMSSHDVVNHLRNILSEKRIGHAGTLDPDAEGVLLVAVGSATRLCQFLSSEYKEYEVGISFGYETDTDDAAGQARMPELLPDANRISSLLDPEYMKQQLKAWNDKHYPQVPPKVSAIHVGGKRAYELERAGESFELEPRMIHIRKLEFLGLEDLRAQESQATLSSEDSASSQAVEYCRLHLNIELSKGGYVRSFARDLGQSLGVGAHVCSLKRTRSGTVNLEQAVSLDDIAHVNNPLNCALDPLQALGFQYAEVAEADFEALMHGSALELLTSDFSAQKIQLHDKVCLSYQGKLYAIAECITCTESSIRVQPRVVFTDGIEGLGYDNCSYLKQLAGIHKRWRLYDCSEDFHLTKALEKHNLGRAVCSLGVFDGVHLGHRYVIDAMIRDARKLGLPSVIVSFESDPDELLRPQEYTEELPLWKQGIKLQTNQERLRYLHEAGADYLLRIPFTAELASLSYDEFLQKLSEDFFLPVSLHVGDNFKLGAKGQGTLPLLQAWQEEHSCSLVGHPLLRKDGYTISSTTIRALLKQGEVAHAQDLLGRAYSLRGKVVHGRGKGKSFGFPTANIQEYPGELIPAEGVYAGYLILKNAQQEIVRYPAAISVGEAPSFKGEDCAHLEVFILGFSGKIYRKTVELEFIEKLRDMRKFDSLEELIETVQHNIAQVGKLLGEAPQVVVRPKPVRSYEDEICL